ncbi:MAG: multiheme c-type cytochrome [Bacillota bacterium]|nr:multiheme c-type cytochrome [Bacillota bacterium]
MPKIIILFILSAMLLFTGCSADGEDKHACADCHSEVVNRIQASSHNTLDCAVCHSRLENHLRVSGVRPLVELDSQICISCHDREHREWVLSPHGQITSVYTPDSLSKMKKSSHPDFPKPGYNQSEKVTCVYCHNLGNPQDAKLLRIPKGELCDACHDTMWPNKVTGAIPAHSYPETDYSSFANHPHNQGSRCITCHMHPGTEVTGGHTLLMRSETGVNTAACAPCHGTLEEFNVNNYQAEIQSAMDSLRLSLESRNGGYLPESAAGTCNQCKKGGMQPFDHDPDLILEGAYQNYLQIHGASGIHNPDFSLFILRQSIDAVETGYQRQDR